MKCRKESSRNKQILESYFLVTIINEQSLTNTYLWTFSLQRKLLKVFLFNHMKKSIMMHVMSHAAIASNAMTKKRYRIFGILPDATDTIFWSFHGFPIRYLIWSSRVSLKFVLKGGGTKKIWGPFFLERFNGF